MDALVGGVGMKMEAYGILLEPSLQRETRRKVKRFLNELLPDETVLYFFIDADDRVYALVDERHRYCDMGGRPVIECHVVKVVEMDWNEVVKLEVPGKMYLSADDLLDDPAIPADIRRKINSLIDNELTYNIKAFYFDTDERRVYALKEHMPEIKIFDVDELLDP